MVHLVQDVPLCSLLRACRGSPRESVAGSQDCATKKGGGVKHILQMLMDVLGKDADEEETTTYSAEEIGTSRSKRGVPEEGQPPQGFTVERVERVAKMIDDLPSDVSQESAACIVREALVCAGIELSNFDRSSRERAAELSSEIELARNRQKEFRKKTEQSVHALEEEIRTAREACDTVLIEEKKKIARASATLEEVKRVRAFFEFPKIDGEEEIGPLYPVTQPLGVVSRQERRRSGPPTGTNRSTQGTAEDSPEYDTSYGRVGKRGVSPS